MTCDDRDVKGLRDLFTEDAAIVSKDGKMTSTGRTAIMEMYRGRFKVLGPSYHWTHDHVIEFDDQDDNHATGLIFAHAEVHRNNETLVAAIRYEDDYRRIGGKWKFKKRTLSFFYYVPVQEYAEALGSKLRQRAYGDKQPADFPESLPTFKNWENDFAA
jgi:ketosteroid isomerase-like protein